MDGVASHDLLSALDDDARAQRIKALPDDELIRAISALSDPAKFKPGQILDELRAEASRRGLGS